MKTMKIFEPAMCCPTGLCGVGVDPELLRISTVLNTLKENGIEIQRYNLTSAPQAFVDHKAVTEFLQKFGPDKLPVVMVDDFIVITGRYPSNEEFTSWLELSPELLGVSSCCEDSSCCCAGETEAEETSCCCVGETEAEETSCCCIGETETEETSCCCGSEAKAEESSCCCCGSEEDAGENCCEEASVSDGNNGGCCGGSSCC